MKEIYSLKLENGRSVKDHLLEMRKLFKSLSRMGYKMVQEELVHLMWFSLTNEIRTTVSAYIGEPKRDVAKLHEDILASLEPKPAAPAELMDTDWIDELGDLSCPECGSNDICAHSMDIDQLDIGLPDAPGIFMIDCLITSYESWVLDTGSGNHICNHLQGFRRRETLRKDRSNLRVGEGTMLVAEAVGSYSLSLPSGLVRKKTQSHFFMKIRVLFLLLVFFSISFVFIHGGEEAKTNKFREREATDDNLGYPNFAEDELLNKQCPQNLELRWQTEVSSSIYATPLIADINSDGKLDVVVPSFVHYLEVLEGSDGDKMPGTLLRNSLDKSLSNTVSVPPKSHVKAHELSEHAESKLAHNFCLYDFIRMAAFHQSTVHASPLLYDIDKDGVREIALATYNGEVLFFRTSGYIMSEKLEVPRLKAKRDWYVGLLPDPVDHSHPDVHDELLIKEAVLHSITPPGEANHTSDAKENKGKENEIPLKPESPKNTVNTSLEEHVKNPHNESAVSANASEKGSSDAQNKTSAHIELPKDVHNISSNAAPDNVHGSTPSESKSGRRLLEEKSENVPHTDTNNPKDVPIATAENDEGLEADADSSFELFRDNEELADEYNYDYDDYVDETMWGDEEWTEAQHEASQNYVHVDSHILCTPVIADIDQDGIMEMIVAVSYFFDHEYYDNPERVKELGGIDIGKYVGGGIVVFNLETKQVKWTAQLDLSTDTGKFRAYIYSSPTVVDLDGDGYLDILVGTSYGLFYVLDHKGKVREKFPLEMAEIQGAVVAADINDDGKIELVTTDSHGNVAAWTPNGVEIWEAHLKSLIPQGVSVGDVDGDGHTDVVVPTISGNIYVLSGKDGSFVRPYPYRTHGRVMNQVLLVDLAKRREKKKGLTIVTTSFDGYLYLIDGPTSCADVVDIGETSYSMVLADNVDGGDDLDLIVTTMNGNVLCFSTPAPYHPLKAWRSHNQGRNNVAARVDREGIYVTPSSRAFRDEEGKNFWVEIEIVDKHRVPSGSQGPYNVTLLASTDIKVGKKRVGYLFGKHKVAYKTSLLVPGNYQGERTLKRNQVFDKPGKYRIKLPTVGVRTTGTVVVEMTDKNKLHFSDEFSLTFHMHYYKLLKWLLVLPMMGMFGLLVILRPQESVPLPSFSRNTEL
ncbi:hypothetical protein OSB04_021316 [Centaurea solstitialis]|uniref:DEX1 C-terminal domain-containing protein n=1 Tax=Centaurea solstitialis TaxID=347529 RepID=A0AA38SUA4_9ASTR|nr:hypothetical protein OSB04_021316 [Centaurea solstitialis]